MSDNAFFTAAVLLCAKVVSVPIQPVRSVASPRCGRPRLRRGRPFFACEKSAPHNIRLNPLILTPIINRTPNRRPLVSIAAIFIRRAGTGRERPDYILFIRRSVEPKAEISEYKPLPPLLTRDRKSGLPLPFIPPVYPPPSPPRRPLYFSPICSLLKKIKKIFQKPLDK